MKISCEVISASTNGDTISIRAQGTVKGSASWRRMSVVDIEVPDTAPSRKAFYVGRSFDIKVGLK